jgi:hypothetical protein
MDFKNKFTVCGMKEGISCKNPGVYRRSPENRRAGVTPQRKQITRFDFVRKQLADEDRTEHIRPFSNRKNGTEDPSFHQKIKNKVLKKNSLL